MCFSLYLMDYHLLISLFTLTLRLSLIWLVRANLASLCSFDMHHNPIILWEFHCPWHFLVFILELAFSSRRPCFFQRSMVFRSQSLGAECAHCLWDVIPCRFNGWTLEMLMDMHIWIQICLCKKGIHRYICCIYMDNKLIPTPPILLQHYRLHFIFLPFCISTSVVNKQPCSPHP